MAIGGVEGGGLCAVAGIDGDPGGVCDWDSVDGGACECAIIDAVAAALAGGAGSEFDGGIEAGVVGVGT